MAVQESWGDGAAKWMRWLARGIGSIVAALWLASGVLHGIGDFQPWTLESIVIAVLIVASALGVLIGWRKEAIGRPVLVIVAITCSAFAWGTAGHNKGFAMLISGGPFLVVGILFLASWWSSEK